jgi:DNA-3-methyladenine glycosylase II
MNKGIHPVGGHTAEEIAKARRHLSKKDGALARADKVTPPFEWRSKSAGFVGLTQLILEQQVSTASAMAIWSRVKGAFPRLSPKAVLEQDEAFLQTLGLSGQKARYVRGIAEAVHSGTLDFSKLRKLGDEQASAILMGIKGIGRWTAEAYLMGCEGRTDIFPAGDLALQEGLRFADRAQKRLPIEELYKRADGWKPYRGVAAHLLWGYYAAVKKGLVPSA